jgi:hypothetical protein
MTRKAFLFVFRLMQSSSAASIVLGLLWLAAPAAAQACGWSGVDSGIGGRPDAQVRALANFNEPTGSVAGLTVWNDGIAEALYVGGNFTATGGVGVNRTGIARWDGVQWSDVGGGMNSAVFALAGFNGRVRALYAGGAFTQAGGVDASRIAKWDGTRWSALGSGMGNGFVNALAFFDFGFGSELYAAGEFTTAGGVPANRIARWNGEGWSALGSGLNATVHALLVFNGGLYAAGEFTMAGDMPAKYIARWNGMQWSAVGSGLSDRAAALAIFDDGQGPALYAAGASYVSKWDGRLWSTLGGGMNSAVDSLAVFDDGRALYAGGTFTRAGDVPANRIAKWDGAQWSAVGGGMGNGFVDALAVFHPQTGGPKLYAGGSFRTAEGRAAVSIAQWDSGIGRWGDVGNGATRKALFAGGLFTAAGIVLANNIAEWDGLQWSALGSGMDSFGMDAFVNTLAIFTDTAGPALYAGGSFARAGGVPANNIARWDGDGWSALGSGIGGGSFPQVSALTVYDDGTGPAIYVGGSFSLAGDLPASSIAKWDGAQWSALDGGMDSSVLALAVYDDGAGPAVYAGGTFTTAGGVLVNGIAKWDGMQWLPLGSGVAGLTPAVHSLKVFQEVRGTSALYAGGSFDTAGGVPANNIAKWDGTQWAALASGMDDVVDVLTVFDDGIGSGPALYAGGRFSTAGGVPASRIAKWDGMQWVALGSGMDSSVKALAGFDATGPALYAGGEFTQAGGMPVNHIAEWSCP